MGVGIELSVLTKMYITDFCSSDFLFILNTILSGTLYVAFDSQKMCRLQSNETYFWNSKTV